MDKRIEELKKIKELKTPSYIVDEEKIINNLKVLKRVEKEAGCKILLAQKAFSMYSIYPLIGKYISGTTASGIYEARLGHEEMGKENHVYSPAYTLDEIRELDEICDHIIFNSLSQLEKFLPEVKKASVGLRINPEFSTQEGHEIYDPCSKGSRMGVPVSKLKELPQNIDGIHVHTLCEQNSDALIATFKNLESKIGPEFHKLKWINLGGGHHISRPDYGVDELIDLVKYIIKTYNVEVYLEPGEAIAYYAGYFATEVMDIVDNDVVNLILDGSASCHMPDVLEMPYRPPLYKSFEAAEKEYTYRLTARTCLAGDIIGDYSFENEIKIGDRLYFEDMAIYSMVKNNTFNGMPLPSIYLFTLDGKLKLVKEFGYEDFKCRLS